MIRDILHSTLLLLAAFCLMSTKTSAQQKMGYVNTDEIMQQIPEYKGVQQQMNVVADKWRQQLEDMQSRIDTLKEAFKAKEILFTEELRKEKQQQIENLVEQRKQFLNDKFGPKGEYFQKQKELLEPIQRKVYKAIETVSQRQNIDFVFDRAKNTSLLYGRKQWNLNNDVLQELGITLNQQNGR